MPQIFFCNKIRPTQVEAFSDREIAHIWKNHLVMQRNSKFVPNGNAKRIYIVVSMHIQKYDLTLFDSKLTLKKNETTKIKFKQMLSSNQNQEEN